MVSLECRGSLAAVSASGPPLTPPGPATTDRAEIRTLFLRITPLASKPPTSDAGGPAPRLGGERAGPRSQPMASYVPLLLLFIVGAALTLIIWTLSTYVGPKNPTPEKMIPYESGSESTGARF